MLYRGRVTRQPKSLNGLMKWHIRLSLCAATANSEVDQMLLHFPITAPWQQVLLEKQRLFLTHGHLFGPENLPAFNQNDVLVYGGTHLPVAEQRGKIFHFNPGSVSIPKVVIRPVMACWIMTYLV